MVNGLFNHLSLLMFRPRWHFNILEVAWSRRAWWAWWQQSKLRDTEAGSVQLVERLGSDPGIQVKKFLPPHSLYPLLSSEIGGMTDFEGPTIYFMFYLIVSSPGLAGWQKYLNQDWFKAVLQPVSQGSVVIRQHGHVGGLPSWTLFSWVYWGTGGQRWSSVWTRQVIFTFFWKI